MNESMKFSLTVRVDRITPAHVYLSIFCGMVLEEIPHERATRGRAGALVVGIDEFASFLDRVRPDMLTALEDVNLDLLERKTLVGLRIKQEGAR